MDRDTLQDDLDLILERSRDDELPGEWDWEPPLGTGTPVAISAAELRESEETDTEASAMQRAPRSTGQRRSRRRSGGRRRQRRRNRTTERSPGQEGADPGRPLRGPCQAARTDRTGARSRATTRQVAPASEDPNTSPDVAPNHRPSGLSSSRANA